MLLVSIPQTIGPYLTPEGLCIILQYLFSAFWSPLPALPPYLIHASASKRLQLASSPLNYNSKALKSEESLHSYQSPLSSASLIRSSLIIASLLLHLPYRIKSLFIFTLTPWFLIFWGQRLDVSFSSLASQQLIPCPVYWVIDIRCQIFYKELRP